MDYKYRIDCHTHAFSDKIADKAVTQLINYYKMPTVYNGTLHELKNEAKKADLDAIICLCAATKGDQVKPAHDWIYDNLVLPARENKAEDLKIFPFGTYHVDDDNWLSEINRLREWGVKGIKLHPEFQNINLSNNKLYELFEEIAGEFILMVHVGDETRLDDNLSTPKKIKQIYTDFPNMQIIAAHLGGYRMWREALEDIAGLPVYIDTSSAMAFIDDESLKAIFDTHDTDYIMLGSDYPLASPSEAIEHLKRLDFLRDDVMEKIMGNNCAKLLGM